MAQHVNNIAVRKSFDNKPPGPLTKTNKIMSAKPAGLGPAVGKSTAVYMSKAGSFAQFVSGQQLDSPPSSQQLLFSQQHQRAQQPQLTTSQGGGPARNLRAGGAAPPVVRPCADPRCTPENSQIPVYFRDLESGKNFCFVCWDGMRAKRVGLAMSLEQMEQIGVTSFKVPNVRALGQSTALGGTDDNCESTGTSERVALARGAPLQAKAKATCSFALGSKAGSNVVQKQEAETEWAAGPPPVVVA